MAQTLAVDFDGVIHAYSKGWQDGSIYDPPMPGALDALRRLMADYAVFIHTTRDAGAVAGWLAGYGFDTVLDVEGPRHPKREFWNDLGRLLVTDRKLPAVAYLDDRAVRFTTWPEALAALQGGGSESELEQLRERLVNQAVAHSELVTKLGDAEAELERVRSLARSLQAFGSVTGPGAQGMILAALKGES
jgi:hypothetical protein